ncbi:hypothetical protein CVU76_01460 [Candidatus Dojkabacteria bacterium HGW-Dojkabacteria-1]|uniref:DUF2726 domain-containing protein n=1 Tax=Candidatus Dojkabacteria bacterium HGW-Dojkabacteria-1 TaxID=2013761 RepID=A0A2N2F3D3_9BACT|nr:MAG: hypothetical protein CVU76_01460 [Candidatus Dojkabacteria bacterium HGW-Dojkabacteria-1]
MDTFIIYILILIPIFALLSVVSSLIKKKNRYKTKKIYQYTRKKYLLTKAESDLFKTLNQLLDNRYYIFPQIHLDSILDNKVIGQDWKGALSHIQRKSIDYVICDKVYLSPLLAIELDDISHSRNDRRDRDNLVERIFQEANMPLLRIQSTDVNNIGKIRNDIYQIIGNEKV